MSEPLAYDEIKFNRDIKLEDILNTPDDSVIGYIIEVDLKYTDNIKEKTKHFPFAPVNKKINLDDFSDYMKEIIPDTYRQNKKMIMDNINYFKDLFESLPDYKKIVLLMFLIKNDVNFLYECGILKGDINFLYEEFKNILLELNEDYLDHIKNQEEAIIEKVLSK